MNFHWVPTGSNVSDSLYLQSIYHLTLCNMCNEIWFNRNPLCYCFILNKIIFLHIIGFFFSYHYHMKTMYVLWIYRNKWNIKTRCKNDFILFFGHRQGFHLIMRNYYLSHHHNTIPIDIHSNIPIEYIYLPPMLLFSMV
jgi:hypothetical protein